MDERVLPESGKRQPSKRTRRKVLLAAVVFLASIVIILFAIWIWISYKPQKSADPDWSHTHEKFASQTEAIAEFGTDLLLEQTVLPDFYMSSYYTEYSLTFHGENPKNRENWDEIICTIYYGDGSGEVFQDYIYINILFSDDYQDGFMTDFDMNEVINGIEVGYINSGSEHYGQFIYHQFAYKVYGDNAELVKLTVEQMLSNL